MMMRNPNLVLVCDLDGVVFDFDGEWVRRWNAASPTSRLGLRPEMPQKWDELHLLTSQSRENFWKWWDKTGGFQGVPPYPGAIDALWEMDRRGWNIVYATNRPLALSTGPIWNEVTSQELVRHRAPQAHHLAHVQRKWEIPASLFIEDAPHNLERMSASGVPTLRINRPWNREADYPLMRRMPTIPNLRWEHLHGPVSMVEAWVARSVYEAPSVRGASTLGG